MSDETTQQGRIEAILEGSEGDAGWTDDTVDVAQDWYNDEFEDGDGRTYSVVVGQGRGARQVSRTLTKDQQYQQIIREADLERNAINLRAEIFYGKNIEDLTDLEKNALLHEARLSSWSQVEAIAEAGAPAIENYASTAAELEDCLEEVGALVSDQKAKLAQLRTAMNELLGTDFWTSVSKGADTPYAWAALGPGPSSAGGVNDRYGGANSRTWSAAKASAGPYLGQNSVKFQTADEVPHKDKAYVYDIDPTEEAALLEKFGIPNYPYFDTTKQKFSLSKHYLPGAGTQSAIGLGPVHRVQTDRFPIGWATSLVSYLNNYYRALLQLEKSPSVAEYHAGEGTGADYIAALAGATRLLNGQLSLAVGGYDHAGQGAVDDLAREQQQTISDQWKFMGLNRPNHQLKDNINRVKEYFKANGAASANSTSEAVQRFGESQQELSDAYGKIFAKAHNMSTAVSQALLCQLNGLAVDAKADADLAAAIDLAGAASRAEAKTAASKAARLQARAEAIRQIQQDMRANNLLQQNQIIQETTDRRNVLFKEQCFLLNYINVFVQQKLKEDTIERKKRLPYVAPPQQQQGQVGVQNTGPHANVMANASLLVSGDPYGFLNKMTLNPNLKDLVNIENHQLSLLQPSIRLYKVVYDEEGNDSYEVEMNFDTHLGAAGPGDIRTLTWTTTSRGIGAGIKSFNFAYEGSNPFAIKKSIQATLKIFAANMGELLRPREGRAKAISATTPGSNNSGQRLSRPRNYKYVDLALKTGRSGKAPQNDPCSGQIDLSEHNENLADLNFRLRAEVGWAPIDKINLDGITAKQAETLQKAIQESYVTLNLTPTIHNFDFDETGQVTMTINYLAYVEEFYDNKNFNIFANAKSTSSGTNSLVTNQRLLRELALDKLRKECGDSNVISEVKEDFKQVIASDVSDSLQQLVTGLMQEDNIHYIYIPYEDLRKYLHNNDPSTTQVVEMLVAQGKASFQTSQEEVLSKVNQGLEEYRNQAGNTSTDDEPADDAVAAAMMADTGEGATIGYFYLSRLVDLILHNLDIELTALGSDSSWLLTSAANKLILPSGETVRIKNKAREQKKKQYTIAYENYKRLRILLGPVEFVNSPSHAREAITNATFGDIPISVKYFIEFMTEKMLKKDETFYSLTKFLNDLMNEFVRDFLNSRECFRNMKTKVRAQQSSLTSWSPDIFYDPVTLKIYQLGNNRKSVLAPRGPLPKANLDDPKKFRANIAELGTATNPVLYLSGPPGKRTTINPLHEFNYFVYFAGQVQPLAKMQGDREADEKAGIFHYLLGREKGLIKNIQLKKTQTKGLAEVRFEQDGYDGLRQLRVVYDVDIDCYANINTYPGTYIYVDPAGFDPSFNGAVSGIELTQLGIGGYYMIVRSEHQFAAGQASTQISAKWVNSIEDQAARQECQKLQDQNAGNNDRINKKCEKYAKEREETTKKSGRNIVSRAVDAVTPWDGWLPWV